MSDEDYGARDLTGDWCRNCGSGSYGCVSCVERERDMRELFIARLFTGPLLASDAIVILAGQDAKPRVDIAAQLFQSGAAPLIVVSGGREELPAIHGATSCAAMLYAKGIAPDRIVVEDKSSNTKEQACVVGVKAVVNKWRRLLLVASSHHMPRAFLTFVEMLGPEGRETIHLVPVPTSQSSWSAVPEGLTATRSELFATEMLKCAEYQAKGDCASWEDGNAYLSRWEAK